MPPSFLRMGGNDERCELLSPVAMPNAGTFLWNRHMLLQVNCRGFAVAQHLQPEPAAYSHPPMLEQKTFMQPERPYFAHHPGRFVFIKDEATGDTYSVPYEPVRRREVNFSFSAGPSDVRWTVEHRGITVTVSAGLTVDDVVELWTVRVRNDGDRTRCLNVYPYFSVGYMSWMNQSARYDPALGGIVARSTTPYQKLDDYAAISALKDMTFLVADTEACAWECSQAAFEGEGGLCDPDGIRAAALGCGDAVYETPAAVLQYRWQLGPGEEQCVRLLFGPARNTDEIASLRSRYACDGGFESAQRRYDRYVSSRPGCARVETADPSFDAFVNRWLGRQVFYHGDVNRLTTDPQTRNFLQDAMGMVYVEPAAARAALLRALSQQYDDGGMPEGITLNSHASLKYINQVPHTDHCVWVPICLAAYLDETADWSILDVPVESRGDGRARRVGERVDAALGWLIRNRDPRGLSLIAQGDWCDPMNMVGHRGKGVSAWLSMATVYVLELWSGIGEQRGAVSPAGRYRRVAGDISAAVQAHLWDGDWFARGITDDGKSFGVRDDAEGRIYLNPQSWAVLANIADDSQRGKLLDAVERQLDTPYGLMLLSPAYTSMREDIGRLTQKHPGSAENGSVYNHAVMFFILALYRLGEADRAYRYIRKAIPGPGDEDYRRRGQLPVFLPNYYRGAGDRHPRTAGRSSQLFHTGAASWLYRIVIEELFGLRGTREGLAVRPQLPTSWTEAQIVRQFRGAEYRIRYRRSTRTRRTRVTVDGVPVDDGVIRSHEAERQYAVDVTLPEAGP
ncbi:MAG: NdvB protein [Pseudomonadota bacterium]